jgi:hypothetical protein
MRIQVSQRDIDHGERGDCFLCPLARAAKRSVRKRCSVGFSFYSGDLQLIIDGVGIVAVLPPAAAVFVQRFDAGRPVKPLSFPLKLKAQRSS